MNTLLPLVRIKGESPPLPPVEIDLDPYLAIHGHDGLMLEHVHDADSALNYLGHRIVSHPRELRSHVQRILLLIRQGDGASLYGALVDLFIALGDKGASLKQRMLALASPLLNPVSLSYFQRHLEGGIHPCDPSIAQLRSALLRAGFCDRAPLVRRILSQPRVLERGPLEEARELLEYGQLDQALETLENALLADPDQPEIAAELLDIYTRMGEFERMEAMREQMLINFGRAPDAWSSFVS